MCRRSADSRRRPWRRLKRSQGWGTCRRAWLSLWKPTQTYGCHWCGRPTSSVRMRAGYVLTLLETRASKYMANINHCANWVSQHRVKPSAGIHEILLGFGATLRHPKRPTICMAPTGGLLMRTYSCALCCVRAMADGSHASSAPNRTWPEGAAPPVAHQTSTDIILSRIPDQSCRQQRRSRLIPHQPRREPVCAATECRYFEKGLASTCMDALSLPAV